jgi:acyl-CoA thioester hydrolase
MAASLYKPGEVQRSWLAMSDLPSHDIELRVRYGETDRMGVVYHAEYLVWCEMGRTEYIRSLGMSYAEMERRGVPLAVAEATVRYHAPARYDDRIRVATSLTRLGSRGLTFDYVITNADSGQRLATARTTLVALDPAGRAALIPPDIRALLGRPAPR